MLDFRMETFLTVCKYMNYTKAANELHITQPAVSQHIHYIEKDYGIKLFGYKGKKMYLTGEGEQLLGTVTTLKHDERALRRLFEEKKRPGRRLQFGVTMTIGEFVIGRYLAEYLKDYPDTKVKLVTANTEELLHRLDEGELDFALVEGFFNRSSYDCEVFSREKYVGVVSPAHPLADREKIEFEDLFKTLLLTREKGSGTREVMERALGSKGYAVSDFVNSIEISNISTIKMMTACGAGVSFFYETAVKKELEEGKLCELQITEFPLYHDFTFIWRKNSIFGQDYRDFLKELLKL